jgi:hypothetical protein
MNERIKELAKDFLMHERFNSYGESTEEDYYEFYPDELQEFIELIVKECCGIIEKEGMNMVPGYAMRLTVPTEIQMIKDHFGVE